MNLSAIPSGTLRGRLVRAPLRLIPRGAVLPVLQGPARGLRWIAGSSTHGCWLGSYEHDTVRFLQRLLRPGDVVYDVGAHVGYYSLVASRLVGPGGHVYAIEPMPANAALLRRHVQINRVANTTVVEAAAGENAGTARLQPGPSTSMAKVSDRGTIIARAVRLDELAAEPGVRPPTSIKIDVEGAEGNVLRGAATILETSRPTIILSLHGPQQERECRALLRNHGYEFLGPGATGIAEPDPVVAVHPSNRRLPA